jgi:hypothetical protein
MEMNDNKMIKLTHVNVIVNRIKDEQFKGRIVGTYAKAYIVEHETTGERIFAFCFQMTIQDP